MYANENDAFIWHFHRAFTMEMQRHFGVLSVASMEVVGADIHPISRALDQVARKLVL